MGHPGRARQPIGALVRGGTQPEIPWAYATLRFLAIANSPEHRLMPVIAELIAKVSALRPVRAASRYSTARGGLLAGGIAFSALFSIVAALTIAWTAFMATLGGNAALRASTIEAVNSVLPGVLDDGSGNGMINPDSLVLDSPVNLTSAIATGVLLWTAVSIMTNIRISIQAMFGIVAPGEKFVQQKLRDLVGFFAMAVGIVLSSVLGTFAGSLGATAMGRLGLEHTSFTAFILRGAGFAVAASIAALTFACLFRFTAAVRIPPRDLLWGCLLGGVAVQVALTAGTSLVSSTSSNPLLAASAGIAALMLFINLLCRLLLLVAAFIANPPTPIKPSSPAEVHFRHQPNYVTLSDPVTLEWEYQATTGQIQVDPDAAEGVEPRRDARYGVPRARDRRPDGEPINGEELDELARRRLAAAAVRLETQVVSMRARLGQRPRFDIAERDYWSRRSHIEQRTKARNQAAARGDDLPV